MIPAMIPPQNIEAEQAILGTCLLTAGSVAIAMSEITCDDFYRSSHIEIFRAISAVFGENLNVDLVTVSNILKNTGLIETVGGFTYLASLTSIVPVRSQIKDFCLIVKEKSRARKLIIVSGLIAEACYKGENVDRIMNQYGQDIASVSSSAKGQIQGISEISDTVLKNIEAIHDGTKDPFGIRTGFSGLDRMIGGLQREELTVIAARPAMGKTTLAMNIVRHVASTGLKVLVFSLEMSKERLVQKTISSISGVNTRAMDRGFLNDSSWPKIIHAVGSIKRLPITIDDSSALSITQIQAKAKMVAIKQGVDLVVVDYLGLAKAKKENRQQEITEISGGLKALAKDLKIPVVALSQLSRKCEERPDKRPMMSDLRESGSIEQDAAVIIFIYRDEVYNPSPDNPLKGLTELNIPKNRYGSPGKTEVGFDGRRCMFYDIASDEEEERYD